MTGFLLLVRLYGGSQSDMKIVRVLSTDSFPPHGFYRPPIDPLHSLRTPREIHGNSVQTRSSSLPRKIALTMHRNRHPKERLNPRPVSCLFCRSRKLRCTREFPCSNCVERGISCQIRPPRQVSTTASPVATLQNASEVSQAEILQRLEKLEEIVRNQNFSSTLDASDQRLLSPAPTHVGSQASTSHQLQPLAADIARLERVSMGESFSESLSPQGIIFMICPIRQIPNMPRYTQSNVGEGIMNDLTRCIWLPPYDEAKLAVEKYMSNITYLHHVIHIPSLWVLVDEFYTDVNRQSKIKPGHVALLLSILASTTYSWTAIDCNKSLFPTTAEANRQIPLWIKATEDVLDYIHRTTCPSLESVQSGIILLFIVCNLEGLAQRFRSLFSAAVMMARELDLHRTDDPNFPALETTEPAQMKTVRLEIGRRVWWYLVATDWMLSRFPGPLHGVYTCNPSQMTVNMPQNFNDEELDVRLQNPGEQISEPTVMSYFLQRIQLAELCKHITDHTPFIKSSDESKDYINAMITDSRLEDYIAKIPAFFRLDRETRPDFIDSDTCRTPGIVIQRYMLNALVQIQRCKLHLPWFTRGSIESAYSHSYRSCLDAARLIIQNELQLEQTGLPFVLIRLRYSLMLYGVAMAGLLLPLEKSREVRAAGQSFEVSHAFRILREAREQSSTAARLLESMEKVLRKHKIHAPCESVQPDTRPEVTQIVTSTVGNRDSPWSNEGLSNDPGQSLSFGSPLEDFEAEVDFEALDWNTILAGLNSSFT